MRKIIIVAALVAASLSSAAAGPFYDRSGNYVGSTITNSDGSVSGANGERTVARGSKAWTYNASGQLVRYGVLHGNTMKSYDGHGRFVGHIIINGSTSTHYDSHGRFIGSGNLR